MSHNMGLTIMIVPSVANTIISGTRTKSGKPELIAAKPSKNAAIF